MRLIRYVYLIVVEAIYTFLADDGWAIASHIALSTLMALFPFLIVLTSLAGFFGSKELADQAAQLLLEIWPQRRRAAPRRRAPGCGLSCLRFRERHEAVLRSRTVPI